jgi:hypothetical protein
VGISRTVVTAASVTFTALALILASWQAVDAEACAASDLDLAHCSAAGDG